MMGAPAERTRRHRVEALFEEALELEESEREAFLAERCAGDALLAHEVGRLLVAHARAAGILDAPQGPGRWMRSRVERREEDDAMNPAGARYGPYRVVHALGRGGMGTVYLAVREDAFMRRVALKVVHGVAEAESTRRRFESERRIMASLDHPNIARLLDGGVTDHGVPYLAMEYVEGLPLTQYCDREKLGVTERLELFRKVCDAVHHAHQSLIIHRDLKPSNILVTMDGEPKLLDFGIAKLQQSALANPTQPVTHPDLRALTPEWASPEQMRGEPLTTASDVFALGVLLYELLTGRHPFRAPEGQSPAELIAAVCERDPMLPSETVGSEDGSGRRGARLRGDLDSIVVTALRKEPGRRYASAEQLSSDIGRYLACEPVLARGDGRMYRLKKLVRRRRGETLAALAVVASLLLGLFAASREARVAGQERDRAARALARAEASSTFLLGLFESQDPRGTLTDSLTARTMLERGLEDVAALDGYPVLRGRLMAVLGRAYWNLGHYDRAAELLGSAVSDLGRGSDVDELLDLAGTSTELADVLMMTGDYHEALQASLRAHDLRVRLLGPDHPEIATSLIQLGKIHVYFGDLPAADSVTRVALALRSEVLDADDPAIPEAMEALSIISRRRGLPDEAEELLRGASSRRRSVEGPESAGYARSLVRLARLLSHDRGAHEEAEALFRRVLMILDDDDPERATTLSDLASTLARMGRTTEAAELYGTAIALRRSMFGGDHASVADLLSARGRLLLGTGDVDAAEAAHAESLRIWSERLGPEHPATAYALSGLARVALARGEPTRAEVLARQALTIRRAALASGHPLIAHSEVLVGEVLMASGEVERATEWYVRALERLTRALGSGHRDVEVVQDLLAAAG